MKFSASETALVWAMNLVFFLVVGAAASTFGHPSSVVMGLAVGGGVFTRLLQNAVRDVRIADKGDVNWLFHNGEKAKRNA